MSKFVSYAQNTVDSFSRHGRGVLHHLNIFIYFFTYSINVFRTSLSILLVITFPLPKQ